jgi:hypothetical protein
VKNFVSAFTAFDGSVDELKHKPVAQAECGKKFLSKSAARTCGLTCLSFSAQSKTSSAVRRVEDSRSIEN